MFDTIFRFDNIKGVKKIPHKIYKKPGYILIFQFHFAQSTPLNKF